MRSSRRSRVTASSQCVEIEAWRSDLGLAAFEVHFCADQALQGVGDRVELGLVTADGDAHRQAARIVVVELDEIRALDIAHKDRTRSTCRIAAQDHVKVELI